MATGDNNSVSERSFLFCPASRPGARVTPPDRQHVARAIGAFFTAGLGTVGEKRNLRTKEQASTSTTTLRLIRSRRLGTRDKLAEKKGLGLVGAQTSEIYGLWVVALRFLPSSTALAIKSPFGFTLVPFPTPPPPLKHPTLTPPPLSPIPAHCASNDNYTEAGPPSLCLPSSICPINLRTAKAL